jgi:hypothetical protein
MVVLVGGFEKQAGQSSRSVGPVLGPEVDGDHTNLLLVGHLIPALCLPVHIADTSRRSSSRTRA